MFLAFSQSEVERRKVCESVVNFRDLVETRKQLVEARKNAILKNMEANFFLICFLVENFLY